MEIRHFSHMHPLVFIEGVGENEVIVCRGCDEPISNAAYKCSHECSFFLHKSCTELQQEIQHPVHPKHPLVLIASVGKVCHGCRKSSESCFLYHCGECDFDLDIKCASNWQSSAEDGHQHVFLPILNRIQFTCNICGEDRKGYARVCSICQLLVDGDCAELARTIKIGQHNQFLTLIFCLDNEVKEQDDRVLCELCCDTVNTKYGAYYCKKSGFVAHLNCARENVLRQYDNLDSSVNRQYLSMDPIDLTTNVIPEEDEGTWDILGDEHPFVGEHKFILSTDKKLEDDKFCEVCMELISGSIFYTCAICSGNCNIFIHDTCGNLPRKKQHFLHKHPLTLSFAPNKYIGGTFICNVCKHLRHGFRYSCDVCDYDLDIQCFSIPNRKHEGHQHSLRLAMRPSDEKCNGCDSSKNSNGAFVCIEPECKFALGFECAILPVIVNHDQYDRHLLKLTCSVEDDSGEYYCFICEKERNPKQWFYYCRECDFAAHPHCILGKYPYIKYGSTFVANGHQHPLTFVRKTQFSPPCDICNEPFEGMGLECSICQLLVDRHCAELARTIQIGQHNHFLTLIFSLDNQLKEQDDRVLCELCCDTVNTKYGAYHCKICGFVAHLNCAKENVLQQFENLDSSVILQYLSMDSVDFTTNVTPEEDEETWDILGDEHPFVGEHNFILSTDKKLEDDKFCEVCMELISGSIFYTCATCSGKCNIFIHDTCGNLPRKLQHLLHKHPLTLSFAPNKYIGGTFICNVCKHLRHGFRYSCYECDYDLDIQCSSIPSIIKHEGHQHSLRLAIRPSDEKCNGCDSAKNSNGTFVCIESKCNFALGFECAILPVVVKHEHDRHPLKLTYSVEDDSGEYYCFICRKERNPKQWFYYCKECDFAAHSHCILGKYPYIKYGSTFVSNVHQHPLTFVRKTQFSPPCDICNEPFEGVGLECSICQLLVDQHCAELALTIQIAAHKDHFLTLMYSLDNQVKEQDDQVLCQLCYKTVNTKYGAYYCKDCGFMAHLNCAKENVLQQFDNSDSSVILQYSSMDLVDFSTNVTKEINPEEDEGTWDILEDEGEHKFILSTDKKLESG